MKVLVDTPQGLAGRLLQADGEYLFSFDANASEDAAPALGMPLRPLPYHTGFVTHLVQLRLVDEVDQQALLGTVAQAHAYHPTDIVPIAVICDVQRATVEQTERGVRHSRRYHSHLLGR